jgi:hypothetical protein
VYECARYSVANLLARLRRCGVQNKKKERQRDKTRRTTAVSPRGRQLWQHRTRTLPDARRRRLHEHRRGKVGQTRSTTPPITPQKQNSTTVQKKKGKKAPPAEEKRKVNKHANTCTHTYTNRQHRGVMSQRSCPPSLTQAVHSNESKDSKRNENTKERSERRGGNTKRETKKVGQKIMKTISVATTIEETTKKKERKVEWCAVSVRKGGVFPVAKNME